METKEEKKHVLKKDRAQNGTRTQKMFSLRLDNEVADWVHSQPNKGRYINDLIKKDMESYGF